MTASQTIVFTYLTLDDWMIAESSIRDEGLRREDVITLTRQNVRRMQSWWSRVFFFFFRASPISPSSFFPVCFRHSSLFHMHSLFFCHFFNTLPISLPLALSHFLHTLSLSRSSSYSPTPVSLPFFLSLSPSLLVSNRCDLWKLRQWSSAVLGAAKSW